MTPHTHPHIVIASIASLACVSLWPAVSLAQDTAAPPPATTPDTRPQEAVALDPGLRADLALLERLDQPFAEPLTLDDAPIGEVLTRIAKATGVRILPDRHVLEEGGGWTLKTVTCVATTPRIALDAAVRSISEGLEGVRLDVASGVVVLTDNSGLRALRTTRTYSAEDLLRAFSHATSGPADSSFDDSFGRLIDALSSTVDPESWDLNGGDVSHATIAGSGIIVTTTPALHHQIGRALVALRETTPTEPIVWTITLRELPSELDRAAERELIASVAAGAGDEVAVPGRVISQPKVLAQPTEPASMSFGIESERWSFDIRPSCVDGRCTYSLDVALTMKSEAATNDSRVTLTTNVGSPTAVAFSAGEGKDAKRFLVHIVGSRQSIAERK